MGGLLELTDVTVRYGTDIHPVQGLTMSVQEGGTVALVGSNGAGKTTLLRALSGTLRFHRGAISAGGVSLAGDRIDRLDPADIVRRGIGHVPEGRRIFKELTVEENLLVGSLALGARKERRAVLDEMLDLFPVLRRKRRTGAALLSGGEQQLLAIGRALMSRPKLLMLDEPSLGLAPTTISMVGDVIARIAERGTTVLLAEQNIALARRLATQVLVLRLGRVEWRGGPEEMGDSGVVRDLYLGGSASGRERAAEAGS
ncbi:ATP-binding cassette domain-containing protein [Actinomadura sp. LD22]|uniref:ATP-binding cassette domain-containing protein n=1 Tax=Actinomadura physcomitrii TaxID=2650748 RepID=A0A6I4MFN0_9ACTN|nr:ABC transporter ATP-binding protein [Actinomadura physcomitrii]MWA03690.1 ATP-binding cassette domain-containing protein [Actinomadura physcomitrii]